MTIYVDYNKEPCADLMMCRRQYISNQAAKRQEIFADCIGDLYGKSKICEKYGIDKTIFVV